MSVKLSVNLGCCLLHRWLLLWAWTWGHIYVWKPPAPELFVSTFRILTPFSTGTCQNWSSLPLQLLVMDNTHTGVSFQALTVADLVAVSCNHGNRWNGRGETSGSWPCEKTAWICWCNQRQLEYVSDGYFILPLPLPVSVWIRVRIWLYCTVFISLWSLVWNIEAMLNTYFF